MKFNIWKSLLRPDVKGLDNGMFLKKCMNWIYFALSILHVLFPIFFVIVLFKRGLFRNPSLSSIIALSLTIAAVFLVCYIGFQLWWRRREKLCFMIKEDDTYVSIPLLAHFVQTWGEWVGIMITIFGIILGLTTGIFGATGDFSYILGKASSVFVYGYLGVLISPLQGFSIILISRGFAELLNVMVTIAENTTKKQ